MNQSFSSRGLLVQLLDLMPETYTKEEKYATISGWLTYHEAPETMGAICRYLKEEDAIVGSCGIIEQWAARVREEILSSLPL